MHHFMTQATNRLQKQSVVAALGTLKPSDQLTLGSQGPLTEGLLSRPRSIRNAPGEREGMYHRGVEEGGGVAAEETQRGETEGSFVRQEAAETRALALSPGTVVEQRDVTEGMETTSMEEGARRTRRRRQTPGSWWTENEE